MSQTLAKIFVASFLTFSIVSCKQDNRNSFIAAIPNNSAAYVLNDATGERVELNSSFVTAKFDGQQRLFFEFVHPDDIKQTGKVPVPFFRVSTSLSYSVLFQKIWITINKSQFKTPEVQTEKFKISAKNSSIDELIYFSIMFDNSTFVGKQSRNNLLDGVTIKVEFRDPKINSSTEDDLDQSNVTASFEMYQPSL